MAEGLEEMMGFAAKIRDIIGYPAEEYDDEIPDREAPAQTGAHVQAHAAHAQFVVAKPTRFEDSRVIVDHLKENRAVVLNLEGVARDLACRMIDFLGGAVYAKDGTFERVAVDTYVITPKGVVFLGGALNRTASGDLGELYFPDFQARSCG